MKIKIAIFISGQPRLIDLSLINYFKVKNIDFDIYIHYWIPKDNNAVWSMAKGEITHNNLMYNKDVHNILINSYNPKKIKQDVQIDFEKIKLNKQENFRDVENLEYYEKFYNWYDKNVNPKVPQSCAYSCKKAFELCDNPDEYDWLIKTRFDTYSPLFSSPHKRALSPQYNRDYHLNYAKNMNINIDFNKCHKEKVNFFNIYNHFVSDRGEPMSEIWIVSNNCKKIFNYYDDLINCGSCCPNEAILYNFCKNNNLEINSLGISYGFNRNYNTNNFIFI